MSALTIELIDDLAARLTAASKRQQAPASASKRQQVPPAQIVREVLAKVLPSSMSVPEEPSLYELMKDGFGCVESGLGDLSMNPKYL